MVLNPEVNDTPKTRDRSPINTTIPQLVSCALLGLSIIFTIVFLKQLLPLIAISLIVLFVWKQIENK